MATLEELQQALVAADKAGAAEDARKLADAITMMAGSPSQRRGENTDARLSKLPAFGNPIGNVQRGAVDVIGGGAQLLSRAANSMGLVPESNPGGMVAGPKDVEAQNAQARQNIDKSWGPDSGFSLVRSGAAGALTMPLAPVKFLQAPTMLGRAVGAAPGGAIAAGMQEVPNPESAGDFWKKKGVQTGVGAATSMLSQPIAETVVKYVVGGLNTVADKAVAGARDLTGANSIDKIVALTREGLKKSGIDFDALHETAKQGLLDDVQKALGSYSGVNPGAMARQAVFRQEGFDPLRHWISKNPGEFTAIENLSHQPVGDPLKQRKADLDKFVMDRLSGMRGDQPMPNQVGQAATQDLQGHLAQQRGKTSVLYNTFQDIAPNVTGDSQRFVNDVFGSLEGKMAGASLPAGLRETINGISRGEIPLTPSTLYQIQKSANGMRGSDGSVNYALGHLSRAIDRELGAISDTIGTMDRSLPVPMGQQAPNPQGRYAADVLKMARTQHANTMGDLEGSRVLTAADQGAPPENFVKNLLGTDIKDLAKSWMRLGNDAKDGVRSQVLDELKRKAFGGASDESGKSASQATLNNYLSDPTTAAKLRIVLGESGLQDVKRLALMLESAHLQPSGSAVNNSKTGGAVMGNLTNAAEWLKANGIWGGTPAQQTARRSIVDAAQTTVPDAIGRRSLVIDPYMEELLRRRAGHGAGLLGGAAAYPGLLGVYAP